jgi:UDP-glucose 4-epimerase
MKVLVTGASGFVGSALVEFLSKISDISVVAMVRSSLDVTLNTNVEYRVAEICAAGEISIFLEDIDVVVHLAGRVHIMNDKSSDPYKEFRRVNTKGTISLAQLSAKSGVKRFIFLSTIKVNGDSNELTSAFSVHSSPKPSDPYSASKYEAELGLQKIASNSTLSYTIIRPTIVYGPGVKGNLSTLIKLLKLRLPIPLKGLNKNRRSMVGIDNLVSLISVCIKHPNALNQLFLVSDNDDISTAYLIKLLGKSIDRPPIMFSFPVKILALLADILGFKENYKRLAGSLSVDIEHTCTNLDWKPPHSVEYGFKKLRINK